MVQTDIMGISSISYGRTTIPKEVREWLELNDIDKLIFKKIDEQVLVMKR